jgi:hypothetical protein
VTASTVTASVTGGTVTFTGTFTASSWPTGFPFSPSGCTGGTNYNGALFFVTGTSTGTSVTASSTSYINGGATQTTSGAATTCTLTGQNALLLYDHTGTFRGASFHAGATSAATAFYQIAIGDNAHTITSADEFYFDSVELSFNYTVPIF